ncbi:hypothetical protein QE152_g30511 [Popillia japonica]|uniref:Uncharacterized protein n=1 Tax=Popillia japonica TaxID=7064 RepID=A0AAW1JEJ1_POPJA
MFFSRSTNILTCSNASKQHSLLPGEYRVSPTAGKENLPRKRRRILISKAYYLASIEYRQQPEKKIFHESGDESYGSYIIVFGYKKCRSDDTAKTATSSLDTRNAEVTTPPKQQHNKISGYINLEHVADKQNIH